MNKDHLNIKRALISVSDKTHVVELANTLVAKGVEIISTGGTARHLSAHGIEVTLVETLTGFPEMMDGRIKTLHPMVLGGVLGRRDLDAEDAKTHGIEWTDLVVCNLYPFKETIEQKKSSLELALENIDIGGPTMIRAAAKNFPYLSVLVSSDDYNDFCHHFENRSLSFDYRKQMAQKAFAHVSAYDALVANYLNDTAYPEVLNLAYDKSMALRYGENPHQSAAVYRNNDKVMSILTAYQHHGKALSYNNLVDAQAALEAVGTLDKPSCVVVKHAMPCGLASDTAISDAFNRAYNADSKSAFGGVIALNRPCDKVLAEQIVKHFVEIVIATEFTADALVVFNAKKSLRLLSVDMCLPEAPYQLNALPGGLLLQQSDNILIDEDALQCVTGHTLTDGLLEELLFAWHSVKHVKSNAIVITKEHVTLGIGGGQVSRVDAVNLAINKAGQNATNAVLASDAFFPFRDSIDLASKAGISAIIQPGGSKKDEEVIAACKEYDIAMVFTGARCFKH